MAEKEFTEAMWYGPEVIDSFCPASNQINSITNEILKKVEWTTMAHEFMAKSNGALISLMEQICKHVMHLSKPDQRYFQDVTFVDYCGRRTCEGIGLEDPLQPDGGLFERTVQEQESKVDGEEACFSWRDFLVAVKIGDHDGILVQHAFHQARALLIAKDSRWFSLVIMYNEISTEARFTFWTRWGLYATNPFDLSKRDGFDAFVGGVVRMLMWKDAQSAGLLPNQNDNGIWVKDFGLMKFVGIIRYRVCARGTGLRTFLAEKLFPDSTDYVALQGLSLDHHDRDVPPSPANPTSQATDSWDLTTRPQLSQNGSKTTEAGHFFQVTLPPSLQAFLLERDDYAVEELYEVYRGREKCFGNAVSLVGDENIDKWKALTASDSGSRPAQYFVKESWVRLNYDEPRVFSETHRDSERGAFGVARMASWTREYAPVRAIPGVKPWNVLDICTQEQVQEERFHQTVVYSTVGLPLTDTTGPEQLVTAVLHAVIGHYNMLSAGWLHCNINIRNIILVPHGEERDSSKWLPGQTNCIGFMFDANSAIRWDDFNRAKSSSKVGTPPFMSDRLLHILNNPNIKPEHPYMHTFTDDLNGFGWILLWVALVAGQRNGDAQAEKWLDLLNVESIHQAMLAKDHIFITLHTPELAPWSVRPFATLVLSLFEIVSRRAKFFNPRLIYFTTHPLSDVSKKTKKEILIKLMDDVYGEVIDRLIKEAEGGNLFKSWSEVCVRTYESD